MVVAVVIGCVCEIGSIKCTNLSFLFLFFGGRRGGGVRGGYHMGLALH